jgi:hypothetical protein
MKEGDGMKVATSNKAWEIAKEIITDATLDIARSERAGYKVYSNEEGAWIADLEDRLECNLASGNTITVWVEAPQVTRIGIGHMVKAMQMHRFGHDEIMAMKTAMETGDFSRIEFCEDCYSQDW